MGTVTRDDTTVLSVIQARCGAFQCNHRQRSGSTLVPTLIDWCGAQRWVHGEHPDEALQQAAVEAGGHVSCFEGAIATQRFDRRSTASSKVCSNVSKNPSTRTAFSTPGDFTVGCRRRYDMHVELHPTFADTRSGQTAKALTSACVHCGFVWRHAPPT